MTQPAKLLNKFADPLKNRNCKNVLKFGKLAYSNFPTLDKYVTLGNTVGSCSDENIAFTSGGNLASQLNALDK